VPRSAKPPRQTVKRARAQYHGRSHPEVEMRADRVAFVGGGGGGRALRRDLRSLSARDASEAAIRLLRRA